MIITDYYRFERLGTTKSANRFDCTATTGTHPELESLRNPQKNLFIYFGNVPDRFRGDVKRKADKSLTSRMGKNLSSLFVPDVTKPISFGDISHTTDAILVQFNPTLEEPTQIEMFVCRGQKNNRLSLFNLFIDGELTSEIEVIKQGLNAK